MIVCIIMFNNAKWVSLFSQKVSFYQQICNVFRVTWRHNIMQRQLIELFKVAFCLSNTCVLGSFSIMKPACISKCPRWKILFDVIAGETSDFQPMVLNRRLPIANSHKVWDVSVVWVVHAHLGSVTGGGWLSESWRVVSGGGCTSGVNTLIHRRHHVGGGAWLAGVDASGGGGVGRIVNRPLHRRMLRVFPGLFLHGSIVWGDGEL